MVDFEKYGKQRVDWLDITGGTAVTVLDAFAIAALEGFIASPKYKGSMADYVQDAYGVAELMLAERNKRFTPQGTVKGVTGKTYG